MTGRWQRAAVVVAAMSTAAPALAGTQDLRILEPSSEAPVFGETDVVVEYGGSEPLAKVDIYLDGSLVASFSRPPYRERIDFGESTAEHQVRAVATTLFGDTIEAAETTPSIDVGSALDVELIQLYVTVKWWVDGPETWSNPADFMVRDESGGRERVVTVSSEAPRLSVVVLLDASDSMKGDRLQIALDGAKSVAGLLNREDEVLIGAFSDRLLRATAFDNRRASFEQSLDGLVATGGTAVLDQVYFALNRLSTRLGRPVIIFFSDGEDVSSVLTAEQLQRRARRSQTTIYWVRMKEDGKQPARYVSSWRDVDENDRLLATLEETVVESGGRVLEIRSPREVSTALQQIFGELRAQIVLGFHPSRRKHDGSWRRIEVRGTRGRSEFQTRAGYVDN